MGGWTGGTLVSVVVAWWRVTVGFWHPDGVHLWTITAVCLWTRACSPLNFLLVPDSLQHPALSLQVVLLQRQLGGALAELQANRERLAEVEAIQVGCRGW